MPLPIPIWRSESILTRSPPVTTFVICSYSYLASDIAISMDPDQQPKGAVLSGFILFASMKNEEI